MLIFCQYFLTLGLLGGLVQNLPVPAAKAEDSTDVVLKLTRKLVDSMRQPLLAAPSKPAMVAASNPAWWKQFDQYFAYDEMSHSIVQPFHHVFEPAQIRQFHQLFRHAWQTIALPRARDILKTVKIRFGKPQKQELPHKLYVQIPLIVPMHANQAPSQWVLVWQKMDKAWQVVDVAVEGASLVESYQKQFNQVLHRHGSKIVLQKLQESFNRQILPSPGEVNGRPDNTAAPG